MRLFKSSLYLLYFLWKFGSLFWKSSLFFFQHILILFLRQFQLFQHLIGFCKCILTLWFTLNIFLLQFLEFLFQCDFLRLCPFTLQIVTNFKILDIFLKFFYSFNVLFDISIFFLNNNLILFLYFLKLSNFISISCNLILQIKNNLLILFLFSLEFSKCTFQCIILVL